MAIIFCTWFFAARNLPKIRSENSKIYEKQYGRTRNILELS